MKCPSCGYENAENALACNLCKIVLRKEAKPKPLPAVGPTEEPKTLDSVVAVMRLFNHVLRVGNEAFKPGNEGLLQGEVPRLASRFFLELNPEDCRKLVLGPVTNNWLKAVALPPDKAAQAQAHLSAMIEAVGRGDFAQALARIQAADALAGEHKQTTLLLLGLGLKRAAPKPEPRKAAPPPPPRSAPPKKGDLLAQKYEIHGVLGEGGFGIVYLAYHRPSQTVMALKTFRDEYFNDQETRDLFRKEAQILVDLDPHPHLLRAYLLDEIHGRLFIALEFIAPDENRLNTLEGHLKRRPPDLAQGLRWAVQFCHGMEFADSRGLRCHRDIKPANPTHGPTWLDKGCDLAGAKRWAEALPCLEKAVEFEPEWPLAWANKGHFFSELGRLEEAQACFGKALELSLLCQGPRASSRARARPGRSRRPGLPRRAAPSFMEAEVR